MISDGIMADLKEISGFGVESNWKEGDRYLERIGRFRRDPMDMRGNWLILLPCMYTSMFFRCLCVWIK